MRGAHVCKYLKSKNPKSDSARKGNAPKRIDPGTPARKKFRNRPKLVVVCPKRQSRMRGHSEKRRDPGNTMIVKRDSSPCHLEHFSRTKKIKQQPSKKGDQVDSFYAAAPSVKDGKGISSECGDNHSDRFYHHALSTHKSQVVLWYRLTDQ